ncbi:hypothetical protein [uncultured Draconibacterium sp.]|uniref:hypothetical protein n=1 Tax=uncultured Draconibacterium sp. TaxID=1573823 RepID=UPI0029C6C540|nr:hypothetical protein [uncultured Draconibacterium sp.]
MKKSILFTIIILLSFSSFSQRYLNTGIKVNVVPDTEITVYFDRPLCDWDGFGVNYVEACQTRDYSKFQQDYCGFSFATEETRTKILDLIFNEDGWKPALTKLFLDPFHEGMNKAENDNNDPLKLNMNEFEHETTTQWMRYFNREGQKRIQAWGGKLTGITTLYGPTPWQTEQKYLLGRNIDQNEKYEVAEYMVSWAKFLRDKENLDIRYISFHNEGDAYYRWPRDGSNPGEDHRDYNSYWTPEQVADFLKITKEVLDANDMKEVGLTPGETQTWFRFDTWGYATAIANDEEALKNLTLMTSHSFTPLDIPNSVYYGDFRSVGQDLIRSKKPDIKAWVTSRPWAEGPEFINNIRRDIYECKVNGLIPWAPISGAKQWLGSNGEYSDGSMDGAFKINEDGSLEILKGYYYYKQITRAGQPGMKVAQVTYLDPAVTAIAFSSNNTKNPNAFLIINKSENDKEVEITVRGSNSKSFEVFRTSAVDDYKQLNDIKMSGKNLIYYSPAGSVTTFFEK